MSYSSDLTKKRILKFAKAEFLEKGFADANLRDIAKNAKVTTGALYNHFKNKDALFEAIVEQTSCALYNLYDSQSDLYSNEFSFLKNTTKENMHNSTAALLDFIYDNFDEIKLLFFLSAGTKYEKSREDFINAEERSVAFVLTREGKKLSDADNFFIHIIATSSITQILEVVEHNLTKEEALQYTAKINAFHYAGWTSFLQDS